MEPEILAKGKKFHKIVQSDWSKTASGGKLFIEHTISLLKTVKETKRSKHGRLDMFVDELGNYVSIIEIKSTDWNKVKPGNLRKLLGSHRRQLWNYIEKYLDQLKTDVCPGLIYPVTPKSIEIKKGIEEYLNEYGIQVVWYDETLEQ